MEKNGKKIFGELSSSDIIRIIINDVGNIFLASSYDGIFRSLDSGKTWSSINKGLPHYYKPPLAINKKGYLFLGINYPLDDSSGIYRSTNNGESWEFVFPSSPPIEDIRTSSKGDIYFVNFYGIYRSTNDGDTWLNIGLAYRVITNLYIDDNTETIYASSYYLTYKKLFYSTNNGNTWIEIKTAGKFHKRSPLMTVSTNRMGDIFVGTYGAGIFRTTNKGKKWVQLYQGLSDPFIIKIIIDNSGIIFAGTEKGGIYRSIDNGATWKNVSNGLEALPVISLAVNNNGDIFAGTVAGIFRSTNQGRIWHDKSLGLTTVGIDAIVILNTGKIFVGSYGRLLLGKPWSRGIYSSNDNGESWRGRFLKSQFFSIVSNSLGHIIAGGWSGVFRSTNNGRTWKNLSKPWNEPRWVRSLAINEQGEIFAGIGCGGIYRWNNIGEFWTFLDDGILYPNDKCIWALAINDSGHIFAGVGGWAGGYGSIYRSTNNGEYWSEMLFTPYPVSSLAINSLGHIFAGTYGGGVLRSTDNGSSWIEINDGLENMRVHSLIVNDSGVVFAGTASGVFRSVPTAPYKTRIKLEYELPAKYLLEQNYPNPFNAVTTIKFHLPVESNISLIIHNVLGQEVKRLIDNEIIVEGEHEIEFDGSQLSSGIYFYKLDARAVHEDDETSSKHYLDFKKMILLK